MRSRLSINFAVSSDTPHACCYCDNLLFLILLLFDVLESFDLCVSMTVVSIGSDGGIDSRFSVPLSKCSARVLTCSVRKDFLLFYFYTKVKLPLQSSERKSRS